MKKGFKLTPPPTLTPPKKLPPKSPAYVVKTNTEIEIERLKYFLFDVIKIFFSIMDSDHSREQSHVERVESHVQNIKTRMLSMM